MRCFMSVIAPEEIYSEGGGTMGKRMYGVMSAEDAEQAMEKRERRERNWRRYIRALRQNSARKIQRAYRRRSAMKKTMKRYNLPSTKLPKLR